MHDVESHGFTSDCVRLCKSSRSILSYFPNSLLPCIEEEAGAGIQVFLTKWRRTLIRAMLSRWLCHAVGATTGREQGADAFPVVRPPWRTALSGRHCHTMYHLRRRGLFLVDRIPEGARDERDRYR